MTTWFYEGEVVDDLPEGTEGFVYVIECLINGKKYVGKKTAFFTKTKYKMVSLKNGTKKRKKIREKVESDWRDYYGSSEQLLNDLKIMGEDAFHRTIVRFCHSKSELSYHEAKLQFQYDVLETNNFYNSWISCKIHKSHIKK